MSTRTTTQHICDRSGRFIEAAAEHHMVDSNAPDLLLTVLWITRLGELVEVDECGARPSGKWRRDKIYADSREPDAIFDDLSDSQRLVVAKLIARLLKLDEAEVIAEAIARSGRPLAEALDLGSADTDTDTDSADTDTEPAP